MIKKTKTKTKTKTKVGRKGKVLTKDMEDRFLKAIRLGCPIVDACGCAGFSHEWFFKRKRAAKSGSVSKEDKRFGEFLDRIKEVEGEATNRWMALIEKAAMGGSWQAAAWKLERRRNMTIKIQQEISGPEGGPIEHDIDSARTRILDKLARIAKCDEEG